MDSTQVLDGRKGRMNDLDDEQRERALRRKLNEMFKEFCGRVESVLPRKRDGDSLFSFDVPYRYRSLTACCLTTGLPCVPYSYRGLLLSKRTSELANFFLSFFSF